MSYPLVSIIIPVYNAEKYIETAVMSVLSSSYKNLEIILVDDGSSDNSNSICKKLTEVYKNIYIFEKENGGASSARNLGLDHINGEFILFLDADDELLSSSIEALLHSILISDADMVIPDRYLELTESGEVIQKYHFNEQLMKSNPKEFAVDTMVGYGRGWRSHSLLFRAKIIKLNNIRFDEGYIAEDMLFNLKFMKYANRLEFYKDNTVIYRKHSTSVTASFHKNMYQNYIFMDHAVEDFLKDLSFDDLSIKRINNELFRRNIISFLYDICSYKNHDKVVYKKTQFYNILDKERVKFAFDEYRTRVYFNSSRIEIYYYIMSLLIHFKCKLLPFYITLLISKRRR